MNSKYNARAVTVDGIRFDSQAEARRYGELKLLETAGQIRQLEVHPRYVLQDAYRRDGKLVRPIIYEGDFAYSENGRRVCEDVKGLRLPEYKLKVKMLLKRYPEIDFREIKA